MYLQKRKFKKNSFKILIFTHILLSCVFGESNIHIEDKNEISSDSTVIGNSNIFIGKKVYLNKRNNFYEKKSVKFFDKSIENFDISVNDGIINIEQNNKCRFVYFGRKDDIYTNNHTLFFKSDGFDKKLYIYTAKISRIRIKGDFTIYFKLNVKDIEIVLLGDENLYFYNDPESIILRGEGDVNIYTHSSKFKLKSDLEGEVLIHTK